MLRLIGDCFVLWLLWATILLLALAGNLFLGLGAFFG